MLMNGADTSRISTSGVIWLKLAVLYLIVGVALGIMMGASENFSLRPVHAHVNLLGWATTALAGVIYCLFPKAGESKLARLHFWLQNLTLPAMMLALSFVLYGHTAAVPVLVAAEIGSALGVLLFAANLFINLKSA
jgi:hypothetical protein